MRETLRFAAIIKLPSSVSRRRKLAKVEEMLDILGLKECADGLVGGELLKGISGGERRRLSLACEMVSDGIFGVFDGLLRCIDQRSGGVGLGRTGMCLPFSVCLTPDQHYRQVDSMPTQHGPSLKSFATLPEVGA